jgi:hypothetical protein
MRQLQLFSSAELAVMRDRTKSHSHSPERDEFRRDHERHRAWGLTQRHAQKLRRRHPGIHDRPAPNVTQNLQTDATRDPASPSHPSPSHPSRRKPASQPETTGQPGSHTVPRETDRPGRARRPARGSRAAPAQASRETEGRASRETEGRASRESTVRARQENSPSAGQCRPARIREKHPTPTHREPRTIPPAHRIRPETIAVNAPEDARQPHEESHRPPHTSIRRQRIQAIEEIFRADPTRTLQTLRMIPSPPPCSRRHQHD